MASQAGHDLDVFDTSILASTSKPPSADEGSGTDPQPPVTRSDEDEITPPTPQPAKPAT